MANPEIQQGPKTPPLSGRRIVITRARSQAADLARGIEDLGGEVVEFPTIEIQPPESYAPLDEAIRNIASYSWLVFTSVNGVACFLERCRYLKQEIHALRDIRVATIGPETAKRLESAGIRTDVMPKRFQAEGLIEELKPEELRGKRVLLPRAARARDVLPETLRRWGAKVDVIEAYRTVMPNSDSPGLRRLLTAGEIDMVTFTSSSTVSYFAKLFRGDRLRDLLGGTAVACIGPITARTVTEMGARADVVADEYTIRGLVRAMVSYFNSRGGARRDKNAVPPRG